jgi:hypothetical protein
LPLDCDEFGDEPGDVRSLPGECSDGGDGHHPPGVGELSRLHHRVSGHGEPYGDGGLDS